MNPKFDYNSIPFSFTHCLNAQCKRASQCLRHQTALRIPPECWSISVVNPSSTTSTGKDCLYFKMDSPLQFALGITHLLDQIPHNDAVAIKQQLVRYFGRNLYYRFYRKEHLLSPKQQKYIQQLFLQRGITQVPVFDEYVEQYEW